MPCEKLPNCPPSVWITLHLTNIFLVSSSLSACGGSRFWVLTLLVTLNNWAFQFPFWFADDLMGVFFNHLFIFIIEVSVKVSRWLFSMVVYFSILNLKNFLFSEIKLSADVSFADIFYSSVTCMLFLVTLYLAQHKLIVGIKSTFSIMWLFYCQKLWFYLNNQIIL